MKATTLENLTVEAKIYFYNIIDGVLKSTVTPNEDSVALDFIADDKPVSDLEGDLVTYDELLEEIKVCAEVLCVRTKDRISFYVSSNILDMSYCPVGNSLFMKRKSKLGMEDVYVAYEHNSVFRKIVLEMGMVELNWDYHNDMDEVKRMEFMKDLSDHILNFRKVSNLPLVLKDLKKETLEAFDELKVPVILIDDEYIIQ